MDLKINLIRTNARFQTFLYNQIKMVLNQKSKNILIHQLIKDN